ncbi:metalloregulator ArsR/SmtB family transcription factor [Bacillus sp. SM2101]|uniref:ArsR/SmtB family transcription factor n=1 Tax=Bacillaceae TaxID=186817 RepID=UPI001BDE8559|nr:metalloregulator ArsR/SmtB family transcription factor [Bacillus sp. SM2101]
MKQHKAEPQDILAVFREAIPAFQVLSDKTRQDIILLLDEHEETGLNVNEIAEKLPLSRPAISHHLKNLKQAGLVDVRQHGTGNYYYLTLLQAVEHMKHLISLLENNCELK